jgi:lipopolysaccharide/colanic/teichoic acid biosynthesis glycosyltransferase
VDIGYHLVSRPDRPYRPLKLLGEHPGKHPLLLVHADRLVQADIMVTSPPSPADAPVLYCFRDDGAPSGGAGRRWTGWGWLSRECLANIPENGIEADLFDYLEAQNNRRIEAADPFRPLSAESAGDLIASHQRVLEQKNTGLMIRGQQVEEAIWLARNVSLHPTAKLTPPLYIGENCRIGKGAQIGPTAVIGSDCVLDEKASVARSIVFPGSYVGEGLELSDAVVDRNCLINVRVGSEITIREDFILGNLADKQLRRGWNRLISQAVSILLLIPALPVLAVMMLYFKLRNSGIDFSAGSMVRLPADEDQLTRQTFTLIGFYPAGPESGEKASQTSAYPKQLTGFSAGWRHFFRIFLPALINIARGDLRFVGVPPRTAQDIEDLPQDWRALYLKSKPGVVTETLVNFGAHATADEMYSAEAVYSVSSGLRYDLKILMKYFGQVLGLVPLPDSQTS